MSARPADDGGYRRVVGIVARSVAAIAGGYGLAALSAVALALALPLSRADAVMTGMMVSFAVFAGAAIWAFAASGAGRAWAGIGIAAAVLAGVAMLGQWQATGSLLP